MIIIDAMEYATDGAAQAAWNAPGGLSAQYTINLTSAADNLQYRQVVLSTDLSKSGNAVKLRMKGGTSDIHISGMSIGERDGSTGNFSSTPTRVTYGGSNTWTIPANTTIYSDYVNYPIDVAKNYLVHIALLELAAPVSFGGVNGSIYNVVGRSTDDTMTPDISSYGYSLTANTSVIVSEIYVSSINVSSESIIKEQGSYSLKIVATITTPLNETVTHALSPTFNLSGQNELKIWVRASRTGTNFKLGMHDSGGTTTESNIAISAADTWEQKTIDISAVADADKDVIDSIIFTTTNADAENTIYLDYLTADNVTWPDAKYIYHGVDRGDGTTGTLHASTISAAAGAGSNLSAAILKDGEVVDDVIGSYAGGGIDIADIVAAQYVIEGHKNYVGGSDGTYHEAQTTEVKNGVLFGASSGLTGTYSPGGTYDEGQAAQLTIDQLAVLAKVSYIDSSQTILSQAGMLDMSLYILKSLLPNKKYLYYNIDRGDGQLGTLRAGNIHTNTGCAGVDLSASILRSGLIVDNITGTLGSVSASLSGVALIRALLESNLNLLSPALETAWENSPFKPTTGTAYQIVNLLFAQPANLTFGDDYFVEQGIFQVTLMYPLQSGTSTVMLRAEAIRTLFKRGVSITGNGVTVRIESTPEIGQGRREEDRWALPVKIRWFAGIN